MFTTPSQNDIMNTDATSLSTIEPKNDDVYENESKSDCWTTYTTDADYSSNGVEKLNSATNEEEDVISNENLPSRINSLPGHGKPNIIELAQVDFYKDRPFFFKYLRSWIYKFIVRASYKVSLYPYNMKILVYKKEIRSHLMQYLFFNVFHFPKFYVELNWFFCSTVTLFSNFVLLEKI